MKRKCLIGLLGLTASLGIVGSGFSAWYFDKTNLSVDGASVTTYVTNLADDIGSLTSADTSKKLALVLDQGGYDKASDSTKGISIVDNTNVTGTVSDSNLGTAFNNFSATYAITKTAFTNLNNAGVHSGTFTAEFALSSTIATYVQFDTNYAVANIKVNDTAATTGLTVDSTNNKLTFTYKVDWTNATADINDAFTFDASTSDEKVNKLLTYKSKPATADDYTKMKNALSSTTDAALTVKYSFSINK